jgi:hypothetical protein
MYPYQAANRIQDTVKAEAVRKKTFNLKSMHENITELEE